MLPDIFFAGRRGAGGRGGAGDVASFSYDSTLKLRLPGSLAERTGSLRNGFLTTIVSSWKYPQY